jgi:chromosome segregation ATPase
MTLESKAGHALANFGRAEYDAEFEPDAEASEGTALVTVDEMRELLGPSQREQTQKVVLAFRKRIREAEREVEEMAVREAALQANNRTAVEHSAKLAAERDHWRDVKDEVWRDRQSYESKISELEKDLEDAQRQLTDMRLTIDKMPLEPVKAGWLSRIFGLA